MGSFPETCSDPKDDPYRKFTLQFELSWASQLFIQFLTKRGERFT